MVFCRCSFKSGFSLFLTIFCWLSLLLSRATIRGATSVGPTVNVSQYYRTNLCPRAQQMLAGKINLTQSISGMKISTAVNYDTDSVYYLINNKTGTVYGGLMYEIQKYMANVGNFTFDYHMVADPIGKSGTPYMLSTLSHFDILGVYYTDSLARRSAGIGFTQGVVDASLVLVISSNTVSYDNSFWNFLLPFSSNLWWLIFAMVVFNTVLYWLMERPHAYIRLPLFNTSYYMWGALTGGATPNPSQKSAKLLNMGYFFVILILTATYTANMATFLILQPSVSLGSINDAAAQKSKICVLFGSSASTTLKTSYPSIQLVIDKTLKAAKDLPPVFGKLRNGECDGVVLSEIDWLTQSVKRASNPNCDLVMIDKFREFSGAMPYLLDRMSHCSALIDAVFSSIIIDMKAKGILKNIVGKYLQNWGDQHCAYTSEISSSTTSSQLSLTSMMGVFTVYCVFAIIALIKEVFERLVRDPCLSYIHARLPEKTDFTELFHEEATTREKFLILLNRLFARHRYEVKHVELHQHRSKKVRRQNRKNLRKQAEQAEVNIVNLDEEIGSITADTEEHRKPHNIDDNDGSSSSSNSDSDDSSSGTSSGSASASSGVSDIDPVARDHAEEAVVVGTKQGALSMRVHRHEDVAWFKNNLLLATQRAMLSIKVVCIRKLPAKCEGRRLQLLLWTSTTSSSKGELTKCKLQSTNCKTYAIFNANSNVDNRGVSDKASEDKSTATKDTAKKETELTPKRTKLIVDVTNNDSKNNDEIFGFAPTDSPCPSAAESNAFSLPGTHTPPGTPTRSFDTFRKQLLRLSPSRQNIFGGNSSAASETNAVTALEEADANILEESSKAKSPMPISKGFTRSFSTKGLTVDTNHEIYFAEAQFSDCSVALLSNKLDTDQLFIDLSDIDGVDMGKAKDQAPKQVKWPSERVHGQCILPCRKLAQNLKSNLLVTARVDGSEHACEIVLSVQVTAADADPRKHGLHSIHDLIDGTYDHNNVYDIVKLSDRK